MDPNTSVFEYTNYRSFLRDYYKAMKKRLPGFGYATLSGRAGFASPSFIKLVINGKRNLTKESTVRLAEALRLQKAPAEYFGSLVFFNQTEALDGKLRYLAEMDRHRKRNNPARLRPAGYRYLEKWFLPVIRELVELPGFREDPASIGRMMQWTVPRKDLAEGLAQLIADRLLQRDQHGRLVKQTATIAAADPQDEVLATVIRKYHLNMINLAQKAALELPVSERSIANTTLSLSARGYAAALKRIEQMRMELLELAAGDPQPERIYQINVNVFPLSKPPVEAGRDQTGATTDED
jgi:uncharacterized protein (TIGR02147 family)